MAKSRKQILQELLDLEDSNVEEVEKNGTEVQKFDQISAVKNEPEPENPDSILRAKKTRTPKQLEAFERAKAIRDANTLKRKEEARLRDAAEKKMIEDKLVKKAISLKKKQIKKQAVLDEISDDDTPIEKIKELVGNPPNKPVPTPLVPSSGSAFTKPIPPTKPVPKFSFF
jgi:hypothetical protein